MHLYKALPNGTLTLFSGIGLAQAGHLNLTTIALVNNVSVFQCWQLNQTIDFLGPNGTSNSTTLGPLGSQVNATWLSSPAGAFNPEHPANAVE